MLPSEPTRLMLLLQFSWPVQWWTEGFDSYVTHGVSQMSPPLLWNVLIELIVFLCGAHQAPPIRLMWCTSSTTCTTHVVHIKHHLYDSCGAHQAPPVRLIFESRLSFCPSMISKIWHYSRFYTHTLKFVHYRWHIGNALASGPKDRGIKPGTDRWIF